MLATSVIWCYVKSNIGRMVRQLGKRTWKSSVKNATNPKVKHGLYLSIVRIPNIGLMVVIYICPKTVYATFSPFQLQL